MKYASININFDSLGEAYGFPEGYKDPSFDKVAERFLGVAERLNFKYSIYVIGKDLENPESRARVKEWAQCGHEIGNHSWSHPLNLGALDNRQLNDEVMKAHDIISESAGDEPKGFISPGWSTSRKLLEILAKNRYEYDTSTFPSLLMYPSLFKMLLNHIGDKRFFYVLNRRDLHYPLLARRDAHLYRGNSGSIVSLPLPSNRFRIACWHTTAFFIGWDRFKRLLKSCLKDVEYFYYLIHPADLITPGDLDPSKICRLERIDYDIGFKTELLERAVNEIKNSGRELITMKELARKVRESSKE